MSELLSFAIPIYFLTI